MFLTNVSYSALGINPLSYFTERKLLLNSKEEKKNIGYDTRLGEDDNFPIWRAPAIKKKPPYFNVRALVTRVKLCAVRMRMQ